jgi:uncharacterized protein
MMSTSPGERSESEHPLAASVAALDWQQAAAQLDETGHATFARLLDADTCAALRALYEQDALFRKTVVMERHGFGRGEYKYFDAPLPDAVQVLRCSLYRQLCPIAERWGRALGKQPEYPPELAGYQARCHAAGQVRPTPLLLRYTAGDYNCLHRDLYGELVFPLQVAILLSRAEHDFTGGEFVLTEQRPRRQSRVHVVPLQQGDAVVFAVNERPAAGTRGVYRAQMRHGVSVLRSGERMTLGVIFHDAE